MILMIDNYDSFTYNLVQYLGELKAKVQVYRNDALTIAKIRKMKPEKIVISSGGAPAVDICMIGKKLAGSSIKTAARAKAEVRATTCRGVCGGLIKTSPFLGWGRPAARRMPQEISAMKA